MGDYDLSKERIILNVGGIKVNFVYVMFYYLKLFFLKYTDLRTRLLV
jgi:hypothetical protein